MCIRHLCLGTDFDIFKHVYMRMQSLSRSTAISLESSRPLEHTTPEQLAFPALWFAPKS